MEESEFLKFVGDTPVTRLINFLIIGREFDYTLTDLASKAGISWTTLNRIFPRLLSEGVVVEMRKIGRARLFKLNINSPIVKRMIDLHREVLLESARKAEKLQLVRAR
jgi:DNA-binding transcriptional ArsR family regulator